MIVSAPRAPRPPPSKFGGMTCAEVGAELGLSPSAVHRIEMEALKKIRTRLQKKQFRLEFRLSDYLPEMRGGMNDQPFDGIDAPEIDA